MPSASSRSPLRQVDADGDGAISAQELLGAFDADGDGSLDAGELKKLSIQLSNQVRGKALSLAVGCVLQLAHRGCGC